MEESKVIKNATWIVACKIIQSLLQLVVGMICARYLGPSNYGLINYAGSIVAFFLPIMKLGLDETLVRELMQNPEKEGEILGTSLTLNLISGVLCMMGVFAFTSRVNADDPITVTVCVLYSISMLCAALEMIQYWYQYKLLAKISSIVMLVSYLVASAYRILLLVTQRSIQWFALTNVIEYGIIGFCLICLYIKGKNQRFSFSFDCAKKLIKQSKFFIFSSLMVVIFQSTDHIMLTEMRGVTENGYYSAAITSATIVQFVYIAIMDSFRPLILERKRDGGNYRKTISQLYTIIVYLCLLQSLVFFVFAPTIVYVLYGVEYEAAISVLRVLVWYTAFSQIGTVRNIWILTEEKQKYLPVINAIGATFNIAVNALLIPKWGACGAAFASLLTQVFTNFGLGFIIRPLRENNRLLLMGVDPIFAIKEGKSILYTIIRKSK